MSCSASRRVHACAGAPHRPQPWLLINKARRRCPLSRDTSWRPPPVNSVGNVCLLGHNVVSVLACTGTHVHTHMCMHTPPAPSDLRPHCAVGAWPRAAQPGGKYRLLGDSPGPTRWHPPQAAPGVGVGQGQVLRAGPRPFGRGHLRGLHLSRISEHLPDAPGPGAWPGSWEREFKSSRGLRSRPTLLPPAPTEAQAWRGGVSRLAACPWCPKSPPPRPAHPSRPHTAPRGPSQHLPFWAP